MSTLKLQRGDHVRQIEEAEQRSNRAERERNQVAGDT